MAIRIESPPAGDDATAEGAATAAAIADVVDETALRVPTPTRPVPPAAPEAGAVEQTAASDHELNGLREGEDAGDAGSGVRPEAVADDPGRRDAQAHPEPRQRVLHDEHGWHVRVVKA